MTLRDFLWGSVSYPCESLTWSGCNWSLLWGSYADWCLCSGVCALSPKIQVGLWNGNRQLGCRLLVVSGTLSLKRSVSMSLLFVVLSIVQPELLFRKTIIPCILEGIPFMEYLLRSWRCLFRIVWVKMTIYHDMYIACDGHKGLQFLCFFYSLSNLTSSYVGACYSDFA